MRLVRLLLSVAFVCALSLAACDRPAASPDTSVDAEAPVTPSSLAEPSALEPSVVADSIIIDEAKPAFTAAFRYPQLRDAGPHTEAINAALADSARAYVEAFRPTDDLPPGATTRGWEVDGSFVATRLDTRLFSAVIETYWYTGGAHGNSDMLTFTYDLATGDRLALADLFEARTAYLDTLAVRAAALLADQAEQRGFSADDLWAEGYAPEAANFSRFSLAPDSLTFYFPPYQVAPYVAGPFAVTLPVDAVRSLLASDAPLGTE